MNPRDVKHFMTTLAAALSLVLPTGCFTGVESTPRITADDVKRAQITDSPERQWLAEVTPEPPAKWSAGKKFIITDPKISLILDPEAQTYGLGAGDTLTFSGFREVTAVTGAPAVEVTFATSHGRDASYRINTPLAELTGRDKLEIPFTIELSMVDAASSLISGRKLWITTPDWYGTDDREQTGRKFVPVTITAVTPGNSVHPLKVTFTDDADGSTHRVFMTAGTESRVSRTFDNLFSFTDPRDKYPSISDATWQNIVNGRVELYMTREECRLALGQPADIDKAGTYNGVVERWTYGDGIYLIFEDGVLTRFRR